MSNSTHNGDSSLHDQIALRDDNHSTNTTNGNAIASNTTNVNVVDSNTTNGNAIASEPPRRHNRRPDTLLPSWIPKLPFVCLVLHLTCIAGSIAIVYTSNLRQVGNWTPIRGLHSVQPSVLLAILAGVSNTSLDFLLSGGIAVVWWRSALKGTTLVKLHYIWNKGDWEGLSRIINALLSGSSVRRVMLATVVVAVAKIADNPLLQRATHTTPGLIVSELPKLNYSLAQMVPDGFVGYLGNDGYPILEGSGDLTKITQDWHANVPQVFYNSYYCDGNCTALVAGAGINATCVSTPEYIDFSASGNQSIPAFSVDFSRFNDNNSVPTLNLTVKYTTAVDSYCNATIITDTCSIQTAVVKYNMTHCRDVVLELENTPTLLSLNKSAADSVIFRKPGEVAGLLTGLEWFGYYYLHANATIQHKATSNSYLQEPMGILASQYLENSGAKYPNYAKCAYQWRKPTDAILKALHQISMRIAISSSTEGIQSPPFSPTIQTRNVLLYESVFSYLWAAIGLMTFAMGCSLCLLWECWKLKGPVTFSPLETGWSLRGTTELHQVGASSLIPDEMLLEEESKTKIRLRRSIANEDRP